MYVQGNRLIQKMWSRNFEVWPRDWTSRWLSNVEEDSFLLRMEADVRTSEKDASVTLKNRRIYTFRRFVKNAPNVILAATG